MVKLTAELIMSSYQRMNPVKDRELDLRGYKIPLIENLGATLNQFDTIDFSDNDIRKLDNFPMLNRLKCILVNNNRIVRIAENLDEVIPNLHTLILTNNMIQELSDLEPLAKLSNLTHLSLLYNPVSSKPHYREFLLYKLSSLRVLDFKKVKEKDRTAAKNFFKSKAGKEIRKEIAKNANTPYVDDDVKKVQSNEEIQAIKKAISNASSLEEIERLNLILRSGIIPKDITESEEMDAEA